MSPKRKRIITILLNILALITIPIITVFAGIKMSGLIMMGIVFYFIILIIVAVFFYMKNNMYQLKTIKLCILWNVIFLVITSVLAILYFYLFMGFNVGWGGYG